jgi:hypothetical protein
MEEDILVVHKRILEMFSEEEAELPRLEEKLAILENLSCKDSDILANIENLRKNIEDIRLNSRRNFYVIETQDIISQYIQILTKPKKVSFVGKCVEEPNVEKNTLVKKYLDIARTYTSISLTPPQLICKTCAQTDFDIIDRIIYICKTCGTQQDYITINSSYKDMDRVNIVTKFTYDRKTHFKECINQYQGKQNSTIDNKVYDDLLAQFVKYGLIPDTADPIPERCKGIERSHILFFLKELGYSKHYEDIVLIHYTLTGIKPDDISHLESRLLDDFDTLVDIYDKRYANTSLIDRKSFINVQYVLYQFLNRYKHPCKKADFKLLKSIDRKMLHDEICKDLFEELGWNIYELF